MKIILAGYMGSGKSLVGKALGEELNLPFNDLDEKISLVENRSISEIFRLSGEIYFRRKESEVLEELLKTEKDFILALGGGTPCYGKNLQLIKESKSAKLVYLKASLDTLVSRLQKEISKRPLISHLKETEDLEDFIRKHLFERTWYYNQSEIIVETDDRSVPEIVEEILIRLN